jgi:predicted O-linked N-acetylglucosamine transferase (SPINDLY family)
LFIYPTYITSLNTTAHHILQLDLAADIYSQAAALGDRFSLVRLLKVKAWSNAWRDFDYISADVEKEALTCYRDLSKCLIDSASGIEYTDTPGEVEKMLTALSPNARASSLRINERDMAPFWDYPGTAAPSQRRLKVGIVSSDFGVHPVSSLIRGMVQFMDRRYIELFCFSLHPSVSWWGENITHSAEHFVWLQNMNTLDAAESIAARGIEILIDLNGHTMNSGMICMRYV